MPTQNLSNLLIHYGKVTSDLSFNEKSGNTINHVRIRTFLYNEKHFYHLMCNGELMDLFELK